MNNEGVRRRLGRTPPPLNKDVARKNLAGKLPGSWTRKRVPPGKLRLFP